MKRFLKFALVLLFIPFVLNAQGPKKKAKERLENLLYYLNLENKLSTQILNDLSKSLVIAEDQDKPQAERTEHWGKIQNTFFTAIEDPDSAFKTRWLQPRGGYPFFATVFNHKLPDYTRNTSNTTPSDSPGRIEHYGEGDETLIIIPPAGFDASIYSDFIEMNKHHYSIYTLTLPGYGGIPSYLREERRQLAKMTWFENIESGLLSLLKRENLDQVFVLGNGMGAQIVTRFALNHPEKTKGVIVIDGPINTGVPTSRRLQNSSAAGKKQIEMLFPAAELVSFPIFQPTSSFQSRFSLQTERIRATLTNNLDQLDVYAHAVYADQLNAMNLTEALSSLEVPVLSIVPIHDALSPMAIFSRRNTIAWQKLAAKHTSQPIQLMLIPNSRSLVLMDRTKEASPTIAQFIENPEGFELQKKTAPTHPVNKSPKSTISQTFSNTDVTVSYSRPAVNEREIFGKLVPFGKVWRAGSNEATEITFSRDTWLEGNQIKAGTYSLFIQPHKNHWTVILNSILYQWGSFNYEQEFDVLRFDVPVQQDIHQERLKYDFEELADNSVKLTIAWDKLKAVISLKEAFKAPIVPYDIKHFAWKTLQEDIQGDGRNPSSSDGKSFSYFHNEETDSLWFRLETYNAISVMDPAISVSIDTDYDQINGTPWYGSNRTFNVDLMLSTGPVRQGNGYDGWNGITDAAGIKAANWINIIKDNLTFYFDIEDRAYYMGLKRSDLGKDITKINLIGSVGANSTWNDDIGEDGTYATLTLDN